MATQIFISYTRPDLEHAERLSSALQKEGFSTFFDGHIAPGDSWNERIEAELDGARVVIVLWSTRSRGKQWVRNEARDGMDRGILLPVMIDRCKVPTELNHLQAVDLCGWIGEPNEREWRRLVEAARNLVTKAPKASLSEPKVPSTPAALGDAWQARLQGAQRAGFSDALVDLFESAIRHALATHRAVPIPADQTTRKVAEDTRATELNAIVAAFYARHALEVQPLSSETLTVQWFGPAPFDYFKAGAGTYRGSVTGGRPNGYGALSLADLAHFPPVEEKLYPTGAEYRFVGNWLDGRLDGHAVAVEYGYYEGVERMVNIFLGQWRAGARDGFGIEAGESLTWDLENLPFMTFGKWRKGRLSGCHVFVRPQEDDDVFNAVDLRREEREFVGDSASTFARFNNSIGPDGVWDWSRNHFIFSGLGFKGV